ncbi:MAG TPA: endolytic transglycosylase MltG [Gemmatimonadaceae bacterium]|nr:endolytic transglycosylase MltG [Gemmatimonadaceae bacterium]
MRSRFLPDLTRRLRARHLAIAIALTLSGCRGVSAGPPEPVRVVIPAGSSFAAAADSLRSAGLVRSTPLFRAYAKLTGRDRAIKAGSYRFPSDATWGQMLDGLTRGLGVVMTATIPEGYTLASIIPLLARTLDLEPDSLEEAVRDSTLRSRLGITTPTIEGYLFPETYTFAEGTSAREAVAAMVREFERRWKPEWTEQLETLGMTRHEIVTLASIVEKEARLTEERPVIAAVYHNRLRRGMLLQADPTVQYAHGRHAQRVLYRHLEIDSRYNTYRYPGLPPGPIASPGEASLAAALNPASVPYLFFVAHPDGHHEFHTTFEGHTRARQEVRRAQNRRPQ